MEDTSLSRIEALARDVLATMPAPFDAHVRDIMLCVEDLPPQDILDDMQIDDPLDLTGLYQGVPLTEKAPSHPDPYPDMIWLFREPLLAELDTRPQVSLTELVRHVMIHELAHHFGWSDADIARVDEWWL